MPIFRNTDIFYRPLLALFCFVRCPGDVILKTYDLTLHLCDVAFPLHHSGAPY